MRDCLRPQSLPEELQHWFLMDAHVRLLARRFAQSIHALEDQQEFLRATRPPFFQVQKRQLSITEEQRLAAATLTAQNDAHRVEEAAKKIEHYLVAKLSALILALDPDSAEHAGEILGSARKFADANWLDEDQNDQAFPYIQEQLAKLQAPPPDTPVLASFYGQDDHPKAIPAGDPWANAAD